VLAAFPSSVTKLAMRFVFGLALRSLDEPLFGDDRGMEDSFVWVKKYVPEGTESVPFGNVPC
jgi:hypothetical protein